MKHFYLLLLVLSITACSDSEEQYLGNWKANYIEVNQQEPLFCSSSWTEIYKLDDGSMRVEVKICDETFFATSNTYNFDFVEFGFVERPAFDIEIVVEGTLNFIGNGEIELDMFRDVYVGGFFASGKDYYVTFD